MSKLIPPLFRRPFLAHLAIPQKLSLIIIVFLLIIFTLLSVSHFGLNILSDVRAYIGGESLWSKAQKDAMYHLMRYTIFHEEDDFQKYTSYLEVPLGDRRARLALERPEVDMDQVREGFVAGRNHPDDIEGMARLFRRYYFISYIREAAVAWTGGDRLLTELMKIGDEVRQDVRAGTITRAKSSDYLRRIEKVNVELTSLEDQFSFILGEGARWLKNWILIIMITLTVVLMALGLVLALYISRQMVWEIHDLRRAAARIAEGDFGHPIDTAAGDEIGDLARSLHTMAMQREQAESSLGQRARELDEANKKLIETEKLKDDFFATVSHELRTPLTLVLSPLETLLADPAGISPAQRIMLETMHNNAVRLLQMVNGLLDFSKLEAGSMEVRSEETEVVELTASLLADFDPILKQRNLRISFNKQPDKIQGGVDRYIYERILFNLLSNAVKFTPSGGQITVSLSQAENNLKLRVSDTGIGIAADDLKNLFQKFRQLEGASTRRFEGTGLGLALVKEFVGLLQGTIDVESKPGAGTTFVVDIPFSRPQSEAAPLAARPKTKIIQRYTVGHQVSQTDLAERFSLPKILIAEDNPEMASYIASLLQETGRTRVATDGEAAVALAAEWQPDLVISDVMMPKKDGLAVCRELKADEKTAQIPVLLLTALTHREALLKGWEAGADEYLFKPFHPKELITRVRSLLAALREQRRVEVKLRQINKELERKVQERTEGLQHLNEELEQFSYIASHDLKEPVRKIRTFSDLLTRELSGGNENVLNYIQRVQASAVRMDHLIESLLTFSRLSKEPEQFSPIPLAAVLQEVLSDLEVAAASSGAQIKIGAFLPTVLGDPVQIRQLFQNLIGNAIKFHAPDRPPEIAISAIENGGSAEITVSDHGIGFDEKFSELIFKPFERLHGRDVFEGVGMGLTICQKIVRRHGGSIAVHSAVGQGTTFLIHLPISKSA